VQPKVYAQYPFISHSAEFIKQMDVSLDDILNSHIYERARERAYKKIIDSVRREKPEMLEFSHADSLASISSLDDQSKIVNEVVSFIIARIIISCVNDPFLIQWYAHYQASLAYGYLQEEDDDTLEAVANDLGITYETVDLEDEEKGMSLDFVDYLVSTKALKSPDWKLVNRDLTRGRVVLKRRQLNRLLLEVIRTKVISEFPRPVTDDIIRHFRDYSKTIKSEIAAKKAEFEKFSTEDIDVEEFPPCIKSLIGRIGAGENISHEGRFAIVSFINTIGMSKEDIIKVFGTAPDFDLSKSIYQIEHIIGEISDTEYTPPECSTMRSYGNCVDADSLCKKEWMTHMLKYYKNKLKWKKKNEEKMALEKKKEKAEAKAAEEKPKADEEITKEEAGEE